MITTSQLSANGTSYHGVCILATLNELICFFGEPHTDYDKCYYTFVLERTDSDDDGNSFKEVFTLYDYKQFVAPLADDLFEWHIGTHEKSLAEKVKLELDQLLEKIRH